MLVVVAFHSFGLLTPFGKQYVPGGFLGVDLFFVLSGFLITALLLGEHAARGRISFASFYRRRALRLLPALVMLLAAHFMYSLIVDFPTKIEAQTAGAALFYILNWWVVLGNRINADLGHLWSLSMEEQFYLVWPLVVLLLLSFRRRFSTVVLILLGLIVALIVHRVVLWHGGTPGLFLRVRTDTRADGLLIGALGAVLWTRGKVPRRGLAVAATVSSVFLVYCVFTPHSYDVYLAGGFTAVALACAIVVLAVMESGWFGAAVLGLAVLRAVGRVSYGLYLWHMPVMWAVARATAGVPVIAKFAITLGLIGMITCASWYVIERPFLRWKDRLAERSRERAEQTLQDTNRVEARAVLVRPDEHVTTEMPPCC